MLFRCSEQLKYLDVKICEDWLDSENGFHNFLKDMGPRPSKTITLDRIDNSKGYEKSNCRWASRSIQNHNKSKRCTASGSAFIGVSLSFDKWTVQSTTPVGLRIRERFRTEQDAATYYDNVSEIHYGDRPNKTEYQFIKPLIPKKGSLSKTKNGTYKLRANDWTGTRITLGYYSKEDGEEFLDLIRGMICEDKYEMSLDY